MGRRRRLNPSDLLWIASGDDAVVDLADWVETSALLSPDGLISQEDLTRVLIRAAEDEPPKQPGDDETVIDAEEDGGDPADPIELPRMDIEGHIRARAEDVFSEIGDRIESCKAKRIPGTARYPFALSPDHRLLRVKKRKNSRNFGLYYTFLLLVTRSSMDSRHRILDGLDPTRIFEQLCADVLHSYWGKGGLSGAQVVGASWGRSTGTRFREKIDQLCENLGEGQGWKKGARAPRGGDGGLDVAVWRKFQDGRQGGLVGFAQCKTGIHWRKGMQRRSPRSFCIQFMKRPLIINPLQIYMIPCRINRDRWEADTADGGLLFDRCRLVQHADRVSARVRDACLRWTRAVLEEQGNN